MTELAGRTALVTGASGFIGSRLAARLRDRGVHVHAVSRRPPDGESGLEWHPADLTDFDAVQAVVSSVRPDLVFHLAGETRAARDLDLVLPTFRANLASTVNLLTAAAKSSPTARVVLAGSLEEPEADGTVATSPYAASKLGARIYGRLFDATTDLTVIALRVFMVYGPGQRDVKKLVPYVVLSLLRGERPRLTSGVREIDWVYVDDVVDAFVKAATAENAGGCSADVGSGRPCSIRALVELLVEMVDPGVQPDFGAVEDRPTEQIRVADLEAAERAIGWRPQVTLEEGLRRTVDWYRDELALGRV